MNKCFTSYRSHVYRKHRDLLTVCNENGDQLDQTEYYNSGSDNIDDSDDDNTQDNVPVHAREY